MSIRESMDVNAGRADRHNPADFCLIVVSPSPPTLNSWWCSARSVKIYQDLLRQITVEMTRFGLTVQPPCSPNDLEKLTTEAIRQLDHAVPAEYDELLSIANGLDWNGLVVYASERTPIAGFANRFVWGFIERNLAYRDFEPMKNYLIFADDGNFLFVYQVSESNYQVVTAVGLTVLETFGSFDELLCDALRGHL